MFNDERFNDTLTNDIVSFEQLGPDCYLCLFDVFPFSDKFKKSVTHCKKDRFQHENLRQTACMVINPILVDNFAFLV